MIEKYFFDQKTQLIDGIVEMNTTYFRLLDNNKTLMKEYPLLRY